MASTASKYELTDEERAKIIEKARRELPERDRRYQEAIEGLRQVPGACRVVPDDPSILVVTAGCRPLELFPPRRS